MHIECCIQPLRNNLLAVDVDQRRRRPMASTEAHRCSRTPAADWTTYLRGDGAGFPSGSFRRTESSDAADKRRLSLGLHEWCQRSTEEQQHRRHAEVTVHRRFADPEAVASSSLVRRRRVETEEESRLSIRIGIHESGRIRRIPKAFLLRTKTKANEQPRD